MSLTLKIGSLVIRTLAKPIGNYIKKNAREHEKFRHLCVNFAQRIHRIDMRMRLGLLQDPAVIDRQIAREVREMEAKRRRDEAPTVKTKEQTEEEAAIIEKERGEAKEKVKKERKPRIRPLSEAKAIDTGANFISEGFLFMVATSIILFEAWRSRRKESNRRDDVDERFITLEQKIKELESSLRAERLKNTIEGEGKEIKQIEAGSRTTAEKAPDTPAPAAKAEQKPPGESNTKTEQNRTAQSSI